MKKIIMLLMALCLMVPAVEAGNNKQLEKAQKKEIKKKLKEFDKQGWRIFGSARTLEVALLQHYDKLNTLGDNGQEVSGFASKFKSKNIGKQMASNSAATQYASNAGSTLKGRVVTDMYADNTQGEGEFDNFYAAYERLVEKEIRNEMKESFTIIKDNGDGTYEMQCFYIVDESGAAKARLRALEQAKRETEMAQATADKISKFVREKVE